MIELEIRGRDEMSRALLQMIDPAAITILMTAVGDMARGFIKEYPPKPVPAPTRAEVYGTAFVSDKQRRFFFWALREGVIDVPYRRGQLPRSERLRQSWGLDVAHIGDEYVATIGTSVSYARLMQDDELQTEYAREVGWVTVQTTMTNRQEELVDALELGLQQIATAAGW